MTKIFDFSFALEIVKLLLLAAFYWYVVVSELGEESTEIHMRQRTWLLHTLEIMGAFWLLFTIEDHISKWLSLNILNTIYSLIVTM